MTEQEKVEKIEEMVTFADAIVVDTCTLLEPKACFWEFFWPKCYPFLQAQKKHITVPWKVFEELKAIRDNPLKEESLRVRADESRRRIKSLHKDKEDGHLDVIVPQLPNATHADPEILRLFDDNFVNTRFVVLTQDRNLATDLIGRAQTRSVRHQPARILTLRDGVPHFVHAFNEDATEPLFPIRRVPSSLSREEVPLPSFTSGDRLTASGGTITLEKQLAKGGEGCVWGTDSPQVAKLYFAMSPLREAKLRKMVDTPLKLSATITYPTSLLTDDSGRVVGVLMNAARGKPLKNHLFFDQTGRCPLLPEGFTRLHLVRVARTIVQHIRALHDCGIVWGDINLSNILLAFPQGLTSDPTPEVWFVDVDCAQIEDYPCLVGMADFNLPFRNEQSPKFPYNSPMKTLEDDRFALATLLFKLLMVEDLNPYQQLDRSYQELALKGAFPYPLLSSKGIESNNIPSYRLPVGHYFHSWKRMPPIIQKYFYQTFTFSRRDGETLCFPTEDEWEKALDRYEQEIKAGWRDIDLHARRVQRRYCATCGCIFQTFKVPDETTRGFHLSDHCLECRL